MKEKTVVLNRTIVDGEVRWVEYSLKGTDTAVVIRRNLQNTIARGSFRGPRELGSRYVRRFEHLGYMEQDALELEKSEFEKKYPNIELNEAIAERDPIEEKEASFFNVLFSKRIILESVMKTRTTYKELKEQVDKGEITPHEALSKITNSFSEDMIGNSLIPQKTKAEFVGSALYYCRKKLGI